MRVTYSPARASALIVHAHPEPASFSTAQFRTARDSLTAQGYDVNVIDLYARHWNPVLDRGEFPPVDGPFKPQREQQDAVRNGTLAPDAQADLNLLLDADLLVLSFPLWWFSVPAILKGWLDRVLVMGATFGGDLGLFDKAGLVGHRAVILATTGGSPGSFAPDGDFGDMADFLYPLHRGVFEFVGYTALEPIITYGPAHMNDEERDAALGAVREAFESISGRPAVSTGR